MEEIALIVNVRDAKVCAGDGYAYPLTKRFRYLYYYLALRRLEDPMGRGGYVLPEEVLMLPSWGKNNVVSVGKQIRRHKLEMDKVGRNIIDAQQKIYGPFRLRSPGGGLD